VASTPESSIDSGYGTGGAESGDGLLDEDVYGDPSTPRPATDSRKRGLQSADSNLTKDIAPWIHPAILGLYKELGEPAAAPHLLAGVTTILTLLGPSNDQENQKEVKKDKILALVAVVYICVCTRLSGRRTD
jgi:hypothetical protein